MKTQKAKKKKTYKHHYSVFVALGRTVSVAWDVPVDNGKLALQRVAAKCLRLRERLSLSVWKIAKAGDKGLAYVRRLY